MKRFFLLLFGITATLLAKTQDPYQAGFYWDKTGQQISCYIKNIDWNNNPDKIQVKQTEEGLSQTLLLDDFQAFEIPGVARYEVHQVQINRSSDNDYELERNGLVTWENETLALRVVVRGPATLYDYKAPEIKRFYYKIGTGNVEALMFKKYVNTLRSVRQIGYNRGYQAQLRERIQCGVQNWEIEYNERALSKYFKAYNNCQGGTSETYRQKQSHTLKLSLATGLINYNFDIQIANTITAYEFDSGQDFNFGLAVAYVLPIDNDKWEFLLESYYRQHQNAGMANRGNRRGVLLDYDGIEVHLGLRKYFTTNNKLRFFADAAYVASFNENTLITFDDGLTYFTYPERTNLVKVGAGTNWGRHHLGLQYYLTNNLAEGSFVRTAFLNAFGIQYRFDLLVWKNAFRF